MTLAVSRPYFDPTDRGRMPDDPNLEDVLRRALRSHELGLHVCMPAAVVAARSTYRVDVQPLLQARYLTQAGPTTLPVIANVPVSMPTGQTWAVKFPQPTKGDTGWLIFADRSLDTWLAGSGGPTDPADARTHDITDAIFIPGLQTDAAASASATANRGSVSDLVLRNGSALVRLESSGRVALTNGSYELVNLAQQLATAASALAGAVRDAKLEVAGKADQTTGVVTGTASFSPSDFSDNISTLNKLAADLASLAG